MDSLSDAYEWVTINDENQRYSLELIAKRNIREVRNFYERATQYAADVTKNESNCGNIIAQIDFAIKSNSAMFLRSNLLSNGYVSEVILTGTGEGETVLIIFEVDNNDNSVLNLRLERQSNEDDREIVT